MWLVGFLTGQQLLTVPFPVLRKSGGCGSKILELRRSLKANWACNLLKSAEKLTSNSHFPNVDSPIGCSSCHPFVGKVFKNLEVRRATSLFCGEDTYVLEKTSGVSWEPMVMWRDFRETGSKRKLREETQSDKAIDCLDWCEV
ncbi:hypothetical protein IFM89_017016 [Coptis chinensis]|uniref:Uncharacterized protein n=1 Tax=Coptis chinensis TaxID=261450 RepID=A0A835HK45_9MAGN|nr:hypothetical protein IFM89_017016 [Coptis chinensis]